MTNTEARAQFDAAIARTADADAIAKLELCREYFCNPEFRVALESHAWAINNPSR